MTSIPLSQHSNAALLATGGQSQLPSAYLRPLLVELNLSSLGDSINLNGTQYQFTLANGQQRQALVLASQFALNQLAFLPPGSGDTTAASQLISLGTAVSLKLPDAILLLAYQNGISKSKFEALAARPQGYPLPNVIVTAKEFQFANGTVVQQDPGTQLNPGEYQAKIALAQGRAILVMVPILSKLDILIGAPIPAAAEQANLDKTAAVVVSKIEPVQIMANFLRKLETLASQGETAVANLNRLSGQSDSGLEAKMPAAQTLVSPSQLAATSQPATASQLATASQPAAMSQPATASQLAAMSQLIATGLAANPKLGAVTSDGPNKANENAINVHQVLHKALSKAGALPIEPGFSATRVNLAAELLKHFPHLNPPPLGQLSDPRELSNNLLGLASLNLAKPQLAAAQLSSVQFAAAQLGSQWNQASMALNASAITTLFQLLLGLKLNPSQVSTRLADYLQQLQSNSGISTQLLSQFAKAGGLESMGQLASSLQLYQQASGENHGNLVWFFALPYAINQRHEQFEGKFERQADNEDAQKNQQWQLQLKFNLALGPLLIAARCHQQRLDIQFKGDNLALLKRVEHFLTPLGQKLAQLGFTPGELSTQLEAVPATLLPGDHFLVKTSA